jgi:hypothetical protein
MPNIESHAPGTFTWIELAAKDAKAATSFYSSLFGWTVNEMPMGPDGSYYIFQLNGRDAAAAYGMNAEMQSQGVPPHWGLYVAVTSADDAVSKATAAGGKVIAPPFDVMDFGRMAVLQDPTGAAFNLWQAMTHHGIKITGEPGTLCWADLMTPDVPAAQKFYKAVFGWDAVEGEDKSGYLHIKNGEHFIGGIPPAEQQKPGIPPHWISYFYVTDADASTNKVKDLGGQVHMGPTTLEGVGRFSFVADPGGAVFALFQPMPRQS